jgi:hypothetical protein
LALQGKESEINILELQLDSIKNKNAIGKQIFSELKIEYPELNSITFDQSASRFDTMLKEIARLQGNIIKEYDKKARDGYNIEFDKLRIEKARQEFRIKNFKKCIELYRSVESVNLINDLDRRIIEFCESHI